MPNNQNAASIATSLAANTAQQAADLATAAAQTATILATKTAETTASMQKDISWIRDILTELKTDFKGISASFTSKSAFVELEKQVDDHEKRIRTIEENMWKWLGVASVVTSVITIIIGILTKAIKI